MSYYIFSAPAPSAYPLQTLNSSLFTPYEMESTEQLSPPSANGGHDLAPPVPSASPIGEDRGATSSGPCPAQDSRTTSNDSVKTTSNDRVKKALFKTTPCVFFAKGRCRRGSSCSFAHGVDERIARPDLTKIVECSSWKAAGVCKAGDRCAFGHGSGDLCVPVRVLYLMTLRKGHADPPNSSSSRNAVPIDGSQGSTYSPSTRDACSDSSSQHTWSRTVSGSSQCQSDSNFNSRQVKQGRRAWGDYSSVSSHTLSESKGRQVSSGSSQSWSDSDGPQATDDQQASALEGSTGDQDVPADARALSRLTLADLCRRPLRGADKFLADKWKQKAEARASRACLSTHNESPVQHHGTSLRTTEMNDLLRQVCCLGVQPQESAGADGFPAADVRLLDEQTVQRMLQRAVPDIYED